MRCKTLTSVVLTLTCGVWAGCSQDREARYVYRDGSYGVIGLERDNKSSRRQAEKMMAQHFPGGYDIVREEEIDTGSRKSDQSSKQASAIKPGAGMSRLLVGIGESSVERDAKFQDELKLHEIRIIYRNRKEKGESGFTAMSSTTPEMYADPNKDARHRESAKPQIADANPKTKADTAVKQASEEK